MFDNKYSITLTLVSNLRTKAELPEGFGEVAGVVCDRGYDLLPRDVEGLPNVFQHFCYPVVRVASRKAPAGQCERPPRKGVSIDLNKYTNIIIH